jgi:chorismate dehydratase
MWKGLNSRFIRGYLCASKVTDLKKIRVGAVSYLNTKPLLYGIRRNRVMNDIELIEDYPANIAKMLTENSIDVGLIPVAATTKLSVWHVVGDFCIGCNGPVASVGIFSDVPLEETEKVILDYQSRTSVSLARILLKEYWKKEVLFVDATGEDYRGMINGSVAGVVIGDRALEQRSRSPYFYDLGEAWKLHTGLPFVFAAWIANKELPAQFEELFNEANQEGLLHIDDVVRENTNEFYDLKRYFSDNIDYVFDSRKKEALALFLNKLSDY